MSDGAQLWTPGTGTVKLPRVTTAAPNPAVPPRALTISDDGRLISGTDPDADRHTHAVTWQCR